MNTILAVDDERTTRLLIRKTLKRAGFAINTARNGTESLRLLKRKKFDLVLVDIWMPGMNGLEVLAQIRTEPDAPRIAVMTSESTPEPLLRALQEQACPCISKPLEPFSLVEFVRDTLAAPAAPPIEVLSALPDRVELLVSRGFEAAEGIEEFLVQLDAGLTHEVSKAVGQVFHQMLLSTLQSGSTPDPNRKVRIGFLRGKRLMLYRLADARSPLRFGDLAQAALRRPQAESAGQNGAPKENGSRTAGLADLLAREMVDELFYNETHNEIVCVKYLD